MGLYLYAENNLEQITAAVEETAPEILIVDSIQTMYNGGSNHIPRQHLPGEGVHHGP